MEQMRNSYERLVEHLEGKERLGRNKCRWRIILKYILKRWGTGVWIGLN
jgi:hypothetical protein